MIRIGLISDTHMPERWPKLPSCIFPLFDGVDLILHAGDLGELWVLDELSSIAPVIAVHGNDDTEEAVQALPYQQALSVGGIRILLCHSHQPDRDREMASRTDDRWLPKLHRRRGQALGVGARVYVYGHTHIPAVYAYDDVLLVNPGAIASGNAYSRQLVQTVAILDLADEQQPKAVHYDLSRPEEVHRPVTEFEGSFRKDLAVHGESMLEPELQEKVAGFRASKLSNPEPVKRAILRISHRCWACEQDCISRADIIREITEESEIAEEDGAKIMDVLL